MATRRRSVNKRAKNKKNKTVKIVSYIIFSLLLVLGILKVGLVGNYVNNFIRMFVGSASLITMIMMFYIPFCAFALEKYRLSTKRLVGIAMIYVPFITLQALFFAKSFVGDRTHIASMVWKIILQDFANGSSNTPVGGGLIGSWLYSLSYMLFSNVGTIIVSILLIAIGIILLFNWSFEDVHDYLAKFFSRMSDGVNNVNQKIQADKAKRKQRKEDEAKQTPPTDKPIFDISNLNEVEKHTNNTNTGVEPTINWNPIDNNESSQEEIKIPNNEVTNVFDDTKQKEESKDEEVSDIITKVDVEHINPNYKLPSVSLLSNIAATDQSDEVKKIKDKVNLIIQTLKAFHIDAEVVDVNLGPTVTQYRLKPAIGVSVNKIANKQDDLAMALAAKSLRIEAPIPGESYVGIEVPNEQQAMVGFRDTIENMPEAKYPLVVPLGRDVKGQIVTADLGAMPHLLIAGSTGSGKSVAINGIISSILMHAKPEEVKLMMVDPKKVELSVYNGIPHLLTPVVNEPRKAARALQKIVKEMEERYELFAKYGQRKISEFNKFVEQNNSNAENTAMYKMPYIVVIVDEMADLMMTVKDDVQTSIIRIAQMGRAAGIHLILATQRPSVDVITGIIKANVPSRIAFAVSSGIDSRTILDQNGAENLLGKGDMIFDPMGKEPIRVQGSFISDSDVHNLVDYVKSQQEVHYNEELEVSDEELKNDDQDLGDAGQDELWNDVIDFITREQKASTSLLQRRFRIGYSRAGRIIDELEDKGYIGPANGSKPRDVYIKDGSSGIER